jgi:subtilisin family serine protease
VLRALGSSAALIAIYYLLPLNRIPTSAAALILIIGLVALIALVTGQVRSIISSPFPRLRAVEALATSLPLFLVLFAGTYVVMAAVSVTNFGAKLTHTDALYFTVTVFTTVGFGDITATSEGARLIVTGQMISDLIILGIGVKVILGAATRGQQRQPVATHNGPDPPPATSRLPADEVVEPTRIRFLPRYLTARSVRYSLRAIEYGRWSTTNRGERMRFVGLRSVKRTRLAVITTSATAFAVGALFAAGPAAGGTPQPVPSAGIAEASTYTAAKSITGQLAQTDPAVLKLTGTSKVPVMVKLDYDALGSYLGNIAGYAATSPQVTGHPLNPNSAASRKYLGYVQGVEDRFSSALHSLVPDATIGNTYRAVYGGVAVRAPANQVSKLLSLPGVAAVQADSLHKVNADPVSDDDASFIGANAAYNALGSSETAGKGVIIADVDTGVWPEHPSFAARSDLTSPPPTADGHARACNFGTDPLTGVPFVCNDKLIEGQVFLDTYNSQFNDELYPTTARDSDGHGTHTTSTAGGNPVAHPTLFGIDRGPIQGIAPGAYLMSYKALGPQGGFDSDLVAAIEQAVYDGANVINYSIGPSTPQSAYTSPDDLAFLDAFDAHVFVSTSAGNSGPGTVSHLGPWETTVGATTLQRAFTSTATLTAGDGATLAISGASIMPGISTATPVVEASDPPYSDAACGSPAAAGTFTGKIVICVRGGSNASGAIGRVQKGFDVAQGGAAGMFLINPVVEDTETDNHFLPAVHFDAPAGGQLHSFMSSHTGVTATFTTGQKSVGQGDVMAAFSSTGPGGDFLKPDIAAPGVQILAGNTPTPTVVASGPPGQLYQAIAGTSMSAPHITGSAALVLALHPGLTPAEVKSALMMTANTNVVEADGSTPASPFDDGAGRVDLTGVIDPGLALNVTQAQMDAVLTDSIHRIDLNEPSVYDPALPGKVTTSRTFTNITSRAATYNVAATSTLAGGVTVSPSVIHVPPGGTATVSVTLNGVDGTVGKPYTGEIDLTQTKGGSSRLHLPVVFTLSDAASAPLVTVTSSCSPSTISVKVGQTTCTAKVQNNALDPAAVNATMSASSALKLVSSPSGVRVGQSMTFGPAQLAAATPPKPSVAPGSSPAGYLDLAGFGVPLRAIGDEQIVNFTVPSFIYDGQAYTQLGIVSDGYLVVGGGDNNDIQPTPPNIPNPARPNNVLAPFWTDLDGGAGAIAGQGFRIAILGDGVHNWLVVQWNEHPFGEPTSTLETFQTWIGINGTQDISFTYDARRPLTDPGIPFQVGAEDITGQFGNSVPGIPSADLVVTSTPGAPGGSATFTSTWRGVSPGTGTVETDLTSNLTRDTAASRTSVTVTP